MCVGEGEKLMTMHHVCVCARVCVLLLHTPLTRSVLPVHDV